MPITLTEEAAAFLSRQLDSSPLASGAGLRIAGMYLEDEWVLTCNFTEGPTGADEVIEDGGARVFLDPEVVPHLREKTITLRDLPEGIALVVVDDWWADGDSPLA